MNISIVCAGKLKEDYLKAAEKEYLKRLSSYARIKIVEVRERDDPLREGEDILKKLRDDTQVVALDLKGQSFSSEELADYIDALALKGASNISFVIGGSLGLSREVRERADILLSFSKLTFPHQLIRIFLLEQVYRSFKIIKNEPYHK